MPLAVRHCSLPLFSLTLMLASFLFRHAADAQTARGNLAFLLTQPFAPAALASPISSRSDGLSSSYRIETGAAVIGMGALIAADDKGIYRTVQGPNGPDKRTMQVANVVTKLGDVAYVAPALAALYLSGDRTTRDTAWRAGLAVTRAGIIGLALKEAVGRERPQGADGGSASTLHPFNPKDDSDSFPSGHTLTAFAVGTVIADKRPDLRYVAYGLAGAVGLSRVVKRAHWPSDVFFGALLGITQARQAMKGNANLLNVRF